MNVKKLGMSFGLFIVDVILQRCIEITRNDRTKAKSRTFKCRLQNTSSASLIPAAIIKSSDFTHPLAFSLTDVLVGLPRPLNHAVAYKASRENVCTFPSAYFTTFCLAHYSHLYVSTFIAPAASFFIYERFLIRVRFSCGFVYFRSAIN